MLVDALLAAGLTVVVITSRQVKNLRSRYGAAGAKDDRFDAFVLADVLRTDRARLRPLVPDMPATVALRAAVRARRDLVRAPGRGLQPAARPPGRGVPGRDQAVRTTWTARSAWRSWPGSAARTPPRQLERGDLAAWLQTLPARGQPGPGRRSCAPGCRPPRPAPPGPTAPPGPASPAPWPPPLTALAAQIKALEAEIAAQLAAHPDGHIFTSPAPRRHAARRPAARRDRRLPVPVPRPRVAGRAGRGRPGHPPVRQAHRASASGGRSTASSATPSATSPPTPGTPAPGPRPSTTPPAPAARTTRTPSASWPAPGSTSSGAAGRTAPPTTRPSTTPCSASWTSSTPPAAPPPAPGRTR